LVGHEFLEPLGKLGEFGSRKAGNNGLKFFDVHGLKILPARPPEKERLRSSLTADFARGSGELATRRNSLVDED